MSRTTAGSAVERVAYTTEAGSATPGLDFQPVQGTLSYVNGPSGERVIEVTVADSGDATVVFELLMHEGDTTLTSYRVYHARETDVEIPLNLP